jgi:hypothetical protein
MQILLFAIVVLPAFGWLWSRMRRAGEDGGNGSVHDGHSGNGDCGDGGGGGD